jgi:TPR repeat protein
MSPRVRGALALLALASAPAAAHAEKAVVAVFEIMDRSPKPLKRPALEQLTEYLGAKLGESGRFLIVPTSQLREQLASAKKESYKSCFDQACQIEIGKAVAAEKSLQSELLHIGKTCVLKSSLYDLRTEVGERSASRKTACEEDALLEAVEGVAAQLLGASATEGPGRNAELGEGSGAALVKCDSAVACYEKGTQYDAGAGGVAVDLTLAATYFEASCREGFAKACERVADVYRRGRGVPRDLERFVTLASAACEGQQGDACSAAAELLSTGDGVKKDEARAQRLWARGCELQLPIACRESAKGLEAIERERALAAYVRGCKGSDKESCRRGGALARLMDDAPSVASLWGAGCTLRDAASCFELGSLVATGGLLPQDVAAAFAHLSASCREDRSTCARGAALVGKSEAELRGESAPAAPAQNTTWTSNVVNLRGRVGERFRFDCPPNGSRGPLWGTDVYTDDSSVCTAAVHAGLITFGSGGPVVVQIAPGQSSWVASTANGVSSSSWAQHPGGFAVVAGGAPGSSASASATRIDWTTTATRWRQQQGQSFLLECPAGGAGSHAIWGSGPYTDDSTVCWAAVHAGKIAAASGGVVRVAMTAGRSSYSGTQRHGVQTRDYGAYGGSFEFP